MLKCITMHINIVSTMALWPCPGVLPSALSPDCRDTDQDPAPSDHPDPDTHRPSLKLSYISYMFSLPSSPEYWREWPQYALVEILQAEELQRQTMELRIGLHDHWMRLVERCQICIIQVFAEAEEKVVTRYKSPGCSGVRASCWETWQ